eukprot:scaffold7317_cov114-Cylindrotheca_fusiformis.AAC.4
MPSNLYVYYKASIVAVLMKKLVYYNLFEGRCFPTFSTSSTISGSMRAKDVSKRLPLSQYVQENGLITQHRLGCDTIMDD